MFAALLLALTGCSNDPEPVQVTPPPVQHMVRGPSGTPDWIVDCQGTGDFTTISDAIDAASDHQWIEVLACTYNETLNYDGKSLWISSRDGSGMTVIDFGGAGQGVDVDKGEGIGTALVGFTLRNCSSRAIDLDLASLYLRDIHFRSNYGQYVIRSISGDLRVDDIDIDDSNTPTSAAIYGDKGVVIVSRSTLTCGTNRGVRADHGSFMIDWSEINCGANGDEAFETEHGVGRIQRTALAGRIEIVSEDDHPDDIVRFDNTIIAGDITVEYGTFGMRNSIMAGSITFTTTGGDETIENSVFVGTGSCVIDGDTFPEDVRNNDFWGPDAACDGTVVVGNDGNISADPMFVDIANGDLHLQAGSPLIDAGRDTSFHDDVDGTRNDMGVYGGKRTLDGGW